MKEFKEILNPKNILVDDRSISDYIILLKKLSNLYNYYNNKNKIEGSFSSLLETDESFLISEGKLIKSKYLYFLFTYFFLRYNL